MQPRQPITSAFWGCVVGGLLVVAHLALEVFDLFPGCYLSLHPGSFHEDTNPFVHVLSEFALFGVGGWVGFRLAAGIRNSQRRISTRVF